MATEIRLGKRPFDLTTITQEPSEKIIAQRTNQHFCCIVRVANKFLTSNKCTNSSWYSLSDTGYALVRMEETSPNLESDMLIFAATVGASMADNMAYYTLDADNASEVLPAHTEGVSYSDGIVPYFALGCVIASMTGGETRIIDGKKAASILLTEQPEMAKVVIEYFSLANQDERAEYPLVVEDEAYGNVLRYRSKVVTNRIQVRDPSDEGNVYRVVDEILLRCILLCHSWKVGDFLFVNNRFTLHDRLPFQGKRRMLRVRFGDTLHQRICF